MNWLCIAFYLAFGTHLSAQGASSHLTIILPQDALYVQTEHRISVDGRERTFIV